MSDVQTPFQLLVDIDQRCRRLAAGLPAQQEAVQSWSGIGFRMGGRFFVAPMGATKSCTNRATPSCRA